MYGIIYVTQNLADGMKYIGQHQCSDENDNYLGSGAALKNAIKKYGRKCFERTTLYKAESQEELNRIEIEFIKAFDAVNREDYYNYAKGGLSISGDMNPMYGHVYTDEERKKIGDGQRGEKHWNYGKHWSDEVKQKISKSNMGKQGWAKGKVRTPEHCRHISEAKKGKTPNLSEQQRKAKAELVIARNHTEEFKQQVSVANRAYHESGGRRGNKPVVCIETSVVYASCYDAARAIGSGLSSISACLAGSCKTVKGFHWRLATSEEASGKLVYVA